MDLGKMSSREIVSYVRKNTGKRITISLKSKKSIIKKATELLGNSVAKDIVKDSKKVVVKKKLSTKGSSRVKEIEAILIGMDSLIKDLLKLL